MYASRANGGYQFEHKAVTTDDLDVYLAITARTTLIASQAAEIDRATVYAGEIANYLARRREAGGFELQPDLMGVLTQIDHMVATLPKETHHDH
jgi:hypothetical protein